MGEHSTSYISESMRIACKLLTSSCLEKSAFIIRIIYGLQGIDVGLLRSTAGSLITEQKGADLHFPHPLLYIRAWDTRQVKYAAQDNWLCISTHCQTGRSVQLELRTTLCVPCCFLMLNTLYALSGICTANKCISCPWMVSPLFTVCEHCSTARPNQCCRTRVWVHYLHRGSNVK